MIFAFISYCDAGLISRHHGHIIEASAGAGKIIMH